LKSVAVAVPKIFHGVENSKVGHLTLTTFLSGMICRQQAGTWYDQINLPTKFEVPNFTCCGNMKGVAKCRKFGGLG